MNDAEKRRDHLLGLIAAEPSADDEEGGLAGRLDRICRAAVRCLPADGAGITIMDANERPAGTLAASSPRFRRLEELQFTLGEGPCVEAYAARSPVLEQSLAHDGMRRWPGYAPAAREQGVSAVFAFPIQIGAARLGVLDVYRFEAAPLTSEALANALGFARICLASVLGARPAGPDGDDFADLLGDSFRFSSEVYQAQGMIKMQLGVSLAEAMVRLRARSYSLERPIGEVAREVIAGTMEFAREDL